MRNTTYLSTKKTAIDRNLCQFLEEMLESEKVYTDTSEKCPFYNPQFAQQKTDFEIKLYRRVKKADPQAVQRGRLFRAALFVCLSCRFGCFGVRLYRRAKRADLYNTSARRSAKD